jgi:hypothetical protein
MSDLLDIAPSAAVEVVKIDGLRIKVRGVSIDAMAAIIGRFPELKSLVNGGMDDDFIPRLIKGCGMTIGPIIAAGCGRLNDEKYEEHAARLLPEQQLKLLKAVFGLTFPNGLGPFIEELTSLIGGAGEEAKVVKVRLRKSPSQSLPLEGVPGSHRTIQ